MTVIKGSEKNTFLFGKYMNHNHCYDYYKYLNQICEMVNECDSSCPMAGFGISDVQFWVLLPMTWFSKMGF
jgi:hypothetical protein